MRAEAGSEVLPTGDAALLLLLAIFGEQSVGERSFVRARGDGLVLV